MAVYFELQPLDSRSNRKSPNGDRRARAGTSNVRRPFRGIERKSDTYAYISVANGDGTSLDLVDSSQRTGSGPVYANFLLQQVQEARMERQQIVETFGAPYVFFFGEAPRFVDIAATLLDTQDFNWAAEWWENYAQHLRGTRLANRGSTALLHYDDIILEGYPVQAMTSKISNAPHAIQLQMKMFVTNYLNVTNIGDPMFPLRQEAILPEEISRDDRTFTFEVDPSLQEREAAFNALKATSIAAIRSQIRNARSLERARQLQRLYAMKELGMVPQGADLLSLGKGLFQGAVAAIRGDNESLEAAKKRIAQEASQAVLLSQQGDLEALKRLIGKGKDPETLDALAVAQGRLNRSLQETLRNAMRYTAYSPIADLNAFLARVERERFESNTRQLIEVRRLTPLRSNISDNFEEYTGWSEDAAYVDKVFDERGFTPIAGSKPSLPNALRDAMATSGGTPTSEAMRSMNAYSWSPGKGLQKTAVPFDDTPSGNGADRYTYSRQWGDTPNAGGSYGGLLGGAGGAGTGGKASSPLDLFSSGSGLPQTDPYGNPNLPPYAFTDGYGPDGKELYKKEVQYGPKKDGSFFGGGVVVKEIDKKNNQGEGAFSIVVLEGSLL